MTEFIPAPSIFFDPNRNAACVAPELAPSIVVDCDLSLIPTKDINPFATGMLLEERTMRSIPPDDFTTLRILPFQLPSICSCEYFKRLQSVH